MGHYDLLVIGTGPAGQKAAVQAAKLGKKVAICERREVVGGVCINTGTVPSKTFREAVLYLTGHGQRSIYGASYTVKEHVTIQDLLFRCQHVIKREVDVIRDQMRRNGIQTFFGAARFLDPYKVAIDGSAGVTEVTADRFVIAVGTQPTAPPDVPADGDTVITSDMILD